MEPGLLLIPGPVPLPLPVREELAKAAMPHYGDAWVKAHAETREMLRYLWAAPDAHVFPIAGPGHAALEAIAYTFLRPGDRVVVVSNGFFGDRTAEVLASHRVKIEIVSSPWGSALFRAPPLPLGWIPVSFWKAGHRGGFPLSQKVHRGPGGPAADPHPPT